MGGIEKSQVNIYRSPAMLVDMEQVHDLAPSTKEAGEPARLDAVKTDLAHADAAKLESPRPELSRPESSHPELGSPVASLLARGPQPTALLKFRPNVPATHGVLAITVQRENESWIADADFQLHVADGFVDTVRLDIPLQWLEPYQLDPPLAHEVFTIPGENRRQLLIRPAAPIKDHLRVRVWGRLSLVGGERLRVPEISASWVGKLDRFVVLPTQFELQQVEWETVGLCRETAGRFSKDVAGPGDLYGVSGAGRPLSSGPEVGRTHGRRAAGAASPTCKSPGEPTAAATGRRRLTLNRPARPPACCRCRRIIA